MQFTKMISLNYTGLIAWTDFGRCDLSMTLHNFVKQPSGIFPHVDPRQLEYLLSLCFKFSCGSVLSLFCFIQHSTRQSKVSDLFYDKSLRYQQKI